MVSFAMACSPFGLPVFVLCSSFFVQRGFCGGSLDGGRHLVYPEDTPLTNLQLTLLHMMGVPVERLGDSTGRFTELSGLA